MTPEKDLHYTLIQYLQHQNRHELSNMIKHSKIIYDKLWAFTGVVSDQRKLNINIKTPIEFKVILEKFKEDLKEICFEIYEDDDEYMATDVVITILASKVTSIEIDEIDREIIENSVYQSFIKEITMMDLDRIEKLYLYEACECAMRNNRLAACTMLGCAAEYLLINLCKAFYSFLVVNGTEIESSAFEQRVLKAKCAYNRLDEFEKRVTSYSTIFKNIGFDNPKLNFNFLDIIRKTRNDSGHPTGDNITQEELQMIMGNYQHFIKLAHKAINELPQLTIN